MTVWLGLHLKLVLLCITSSLWKFSLPFVQFSFSISQYFLSFHKFNSGEILWPDSLPDANRYDDATQYFFWVTISRWFPTKTEERFTCPWDGYCILLGIKLLFQKISGVIKTQILFNHLVIKIQIFSLGRLNPLNASVSLILKPVNWFALQINWLVSIWGQHWHLMG